MTARAAFTGSLAHQLAAQAAAVRFNGLPAEVVEKAKLCLLDYIACALEARQLPWSRQARAVIAPAPSGAGLIGQGAFASSSDAAFANGVAGHGLVREDMHAGAIAHLGVVVWPALLACAARENASGARLLTAAIVGYEVGARLGRAIMTAELARLFRPTGLVGAPAASLALGHLSGLDPERAANAFSLACNTVSGLNQWPHSGGSEMYFHPGFAARNAITAHDLAREGAVASPAILEGEAGLFAAYARRGFDGPLALFADGEAELLSVFNKEVPACNFAQTPCQAALRALHKAGEGARIEHVDLYVTEAAERYPGCNGRGPFANPLQAKMSIYFGVAATLARGEIAEANYSGIDDAGIARLIATTTLHVDPVLTKAFPARQGARVRLTLGDGRVVEDALDDVMPASPALIRARFMENARSAWGEEAAQTVAGRIARLEDDPDAGGLDALCARAAGAGSNG